MSTFLILLGGRLTPAPRLAAQIAGARVIAADSGMRHAETLGVTPELWVGDFDSAAPGLHARFAHVPKHVFPADKDATDGELAIEEALKRDARRLIIAGAFGGQADHLLGTFANAILAAERGVDVHLTSGDEEGWPLIPGALAPDLGPGTRLSIAPLSALTGLSISGVKWPLERRDVTYGSSLTISNEVTGPVAISLRAGRAMVLAYP